MMITLDNFHRSFGAVRRRENVTYSHRVGLFLL